MWRVSINIGIIDTPPEKAVEGYRSPRRCASFDDVCDSRSVLECASPLALCEMRGFSQIEFVLIGEIRVCILSRSENA